MYVTPRASVALFRSCLHQHSMEGYMYRQRRTCSTPHHHPLQKEWWQINCYPSLFTWFFPWAYLSTANGGDKNKKKNNNCLPSLTSQGFSAHRRSSWRRSGFAVFVYRNRRRVYRRWRKSSAGRRRKRGVWLGLVKTFDNRERESALSV